MERSPEIVIQAVPGLPEVRRGDALDVLLLDAMRKAGQVFHDGDILVVAHKIFSKAEGRVVDLSTVTPGQEALRLGAELNKDPRKVEVILGETAEIIRAKRHAGSTQGVLICRHKRGYISANAGVDESNIPGAGFVVLLPEDPEASVRALRASLQAATGKRIGVVMTDTFGRAWRKGIVNIALATDGPPALLDTVGQPDRHGRELIASSPGFVDEIAAAAGLLMTKADGRPAILIKGLQWIEADRSVKELQRPPEEDLFL